MPPKVTKKLPCGKGITISGSLKMKDFRKWVKAEQAGDLDVAYTYLARVVESWDMVDEKGKALDPKKPASFDELELVEYQQVNQAVSEWLRAEVESKN